MGMLTGIRTLPRGELLRLCAAGILLVGLCCAALVYATATDDADGPGEAAGQGVGYVTEGGQSFAVLPQDSRSYQRSLEYYGGKSALLMLELRQWFAGLWHGSALALVIVCGAVLAAGGFLYAAGADEDDEADEPDGPGGPDKIDEADEPGRPGKSGGKSGGRGGGAQP